MRHLIFRFFFITQTRVRTHTPTHLHSLVLTIIVIQTHTHMPIPALSYLTSVSRLKWSANLSSPTGVKWLQLLDELQHPIGPHHHTTQLGWPRRPHSRVWPPRGPTLGVLQRQVRDRDRNRSRNREGGGIGCGTSSVWLNSRLPT